MKTITVDGKVRLVSKSVKRLSWEQTHIFDTVSTRRCSNCKHREEGLEDMTTFCLLMKDSGVEDNLVETPHETVCDRHDWEDE